MIDLRSAERVARDTFGPHVVRVTAVLNFNGRHNSYRVTMPNEVIHWLSRKGRHEKEICCRARTKQEQSKVEVVRR